MHADRRRKSFVLVLIIFLLLLALFLPMIYFLSNHLSKTSRVDADILLVEGWLHPAAIELAEKEFTDHNYRHIITTGLNSSEYYILSMNGYLVFYPRIKISKNNGSQDHVIEVDCYSELGGIYSAKFNLFVNNSQIASFTAEKKKKKYTAKWAGYLKDVDSIMVQFVNDGVGEWGDKNLYVKGIIIDNSISINYQNNSVYDFSRPDRKRRVSNNFTSYAQLARSRLLSLGIDSSLVTAVPGKRVRVNRTLTSALAFRDWLKGSDMKAKGINIITLGAHAERTYMTYNKILGKKYKIGIISLPDSRLRSSEKFRILNTLYESVGIIYYWFILLPY